MFPKAEFPAVYAAIENGIQRQLHTGVQIYVSRGGQVLLNSAHGEMSPGRPMTSETVMPWRSAGKPITAALVVQSIERGLCSRTARLKDILPESENTDKADLLLVELLTHQSGFPQTETGWPRAEWQESVSRSLSEPRQLPAGTAAYHPQSSWFVLGEVLLRLHGLTSWSEFITAKGLDPLGMHRSFCGVADLTSAMEGLQQRGLPALYEREQGQLQVSPWTQGEWISRASPGSNLRGPVSDLGRFYEMLLNRGVGYAGNPFLSESSVQDMTTRHRVGQFDETLQHTVDFGLGVICNSSRYGTETVPYGFGRFAGESAFGHGGSQCSMAFCDPMNSLVVAWAANGFCGEAQHQRRNRSINEAVYSDLSFDVAVR